MELTGKGLKDAKETVDNSPAPLIVDCPKERATHIKITLETNGAKVEITPTNSTQQTGILQKISTPIFYKKYIESFIKTIQSHGTSH